MRIASTLSLLMALGLPVAAGADAFDEAMSALRNGDPGTGAVLFHGLADAGDATAMYNLALLYHHGIGVPQNADLALYWAWRARLLGVENGIKLVETLTAGLSPARREALHGRLIAELQAEADAGLAEDAGLAFLRLALVESGLAPKPDGLQAYVWYSLAAALGQSAAAALRDATRSTLKPKEAEGAEAKALDAFAGWCGVKGAVSPAVCSVVVAGG